MENRKRTLRSDTRRAAAAAKQRRIQQDTCSGVLSLLTIPQDPRIHIAEYLDGNDLAEFACVSQQCREESASPILSQDRWGILTILPETPVDRILSTLGDAQDRGAFRRINCLKIQYLERQGMESATIAEVQDMLRSIRLFNITRLELISPLEREGGRLRSDVPRCIPSFLSKIMPNLRHVNLRVNTNAYAASNFAKCRSLETFSWETTNITVHVDGREFKRSHRLKALFMDNSRFEGTRDQWDFPERLDFFSHVPRTVERVSLKNATCWFYEHRRTVEASIPQDALISFVRKAPNLRWFRSDLTDENVAMLQAELGPEITFVTE